MAAAPRLYLRKAARADIAEAFRWYEARSTGLGFEFLRAVRVALAGIERAPPSSTRLPSTTFGRHSSAALPVHRVLRRPLGWPLRDRGDAWPPPPTALAIASLTYTVR